MVLELTSVVFLSLAGQVPLPGGAVAGFVSSAPDGSPIAGARVELLSEGSAAYSDDTGAFAVGSGAAPGTDTLLVSYQGYSTVRIPLGDRAGINFPLRVVLRARPVFQPQNHGQRRAREEAEAFIRATGGLPWRFEDFQNLLPWASHVLDLLLYSGLVADVERTGGDKRCIRLRHDSACARVLLDPEPEPDPGSDPWFLVGSWVNAFVIVPPGPAGTSQANEHPGGLVVLFTQPRSQ